MAFSGKNGTVTVGGTAVTEVTKWTFEPSAAVAKYASNNTSGHKAAVAGVRDGKGTVEMKHNGTSLPWTAGQSVTLVLSNGADLAGTISVPAIIASSPITTDIDNGEPVSATYSFEANGAWTGSGIYSNI